MNMFAKTVRSLVALVVLCLASLASSGSAYAADYGWTNSAIGSSYSTPQAACAALIALQTGWTHTATSLIGGTSYSCEGHSVSQNRYTIIGNVVRVGDSCTPPAVVNEIGGCSNAPPANNCPEAGTSAGIRNITTAWANGPGVGANIQQKILPDGALGNPGSVSYCVSSCGIANSGSGVTGCWQSTVASDTGLHRISCDVPMNHTGQPCTAGTGAGQTPDPTVAPPAPACAGAFGTVNGKPTCLDSSGSTPNNTTPAPLPGNPAPGTVGGGDKSTGVDTGTGAGTGTDGTGTGGAGGGGTGGGGSVTIDLKDLATCGLPGKPKCQMDESGTPTGSDTKITDEQVKVVTDGRISEMGKKQDSWGLSWNFQLPQGACQPLDMSFKGVGGSFDWCPYLQKLRSIIGYFYVMLTLLGIYMSYSNAVKFNKS